MTLDPSQVSAVIVTRGNVDLSPILETLIFEDVVVFDNSQEPEDAMTYGRALAVQRAKHSVIYSQDDDIIHSPENQQRIIDEYRIGTLTGCMWPEWSDGARRQGIPDGYDDLVFAGSGSVYDGWVATTAARRYLDHYPADDFFRLWADTIIGILAQNQQIDVRFEERDCGNDRYRMAWMPDAVKLKTEAIRRARQIRDAKPDAHAHYMAEHRAGRVHEHRYL